MSRGKPLADEERQVRSKRVRELHDHGMSQRGIAKELHCSRDVVRGITGVARRDPKYCKFCKTQLHHLNKTGICRSNPACRKENLRLRNFTVEERKRAARPKCKGCGGPIKSSNVYGICKRNSECNRARKKAETARHRQKARDRKREQRRTPEGWCEIRLAGAKSKSKGTTDLNVEYLMEMWGDGHCPVRNCGAEFLLGCPVTKDPTPSLDRIYPDRGYIKGNVRIICFSCNRLKSTMSAIQMVDMALDTLSAEIWADDWHQLQ